MYCLHLQKISKEQNILLNYNIYTTINLYKIMREKQTRQAFIGFLILSLISTTSCIDNDYDLNKDIDMTINVGGEYLAFPVGSTEKIMMDKIIEINDGDDLQLVDGEYHLLKDGTVDDATTEVKNVTVEGRDNEIEKITAANETTMPDAEGKIETEINQVGDINANANDIDEAVKEIGSLEAVVETDLFLKLTLAGELNYESIDTELKVTFPEFLQFAADKNLNGNILTLNLSNENLKVGVPYTYPLKLTGYKFGSKAEEGRKIEEGRLEINDKVTIKGVAHVKINGSITAGTSLDILPVVTLADMPVKSITGIIQPTIEETGSTVELSSLPDFLQDDATELDITNTIFTFIATNPLNAPVVLSGTMLGKKEGKIITGSTVTLGKNSVDGQEITLDKGKNVIALSRLGTGGPEGSKNIKISDINNLIRKIPDVVSVTLQPAVEYNKYYTVDLGKTYSMNSNYDIDIPLNFGNGLQIVYKDSIDDLRSDLEDVDFKKAIIEITADNIIPLQLEIKENNVTAKDINCKKIDDIKVTVDGTIAESKDGKAVASSKLTITLEETKEGAMSNMDGLVFKVTAVPGQATNVQLRSDQWMQLKDMKLRVPNGIKVDLN